MLMWGSLYIRMESILGESKGEENILGSHQV